MSRKVLFLSSTPASPTRLTAREYNLRLSDFRARMIRERLIAYPLPSEMMRMLPLGEDEPSFNNNTWEGKLSNRRVDVILKRIVF
mgnify:CR=1 FL=1